VESHYSGATAGDKLIACLADTTLPVGASCDMRGIVAETTQPVSLGTAPIEIGRNHPQQVIWPDCSGPTNTYCGAVLHTAATFLPTPTTVVSGVGTGGSLPADTYHITTNWNTGNAPGLCLRSRSSPQAGRQAVYRLRLRRPAHSTRWSFRSISQILRWVEVALKHGRLP
jgi:hypothetical protein